MITILRTLCSRAAHHHRQMDRLLFHEVVAYCSGLSRLPQIEQARGATSPGFSETSGLLQELGRCVCLSERDHGDRHRALGIPNLEKLRDAALPISRSHCCGVDEMVRLCRLACSRFPPNYLLPRSSSENTEDLLGFNPTCSSRLYAAITKPSILQSCCLPSAIHDHFANNMEQRSLQISLCPRTCCNFKSQRMRIHSGDSTSRHSSGITDRVH